MKTVYLGLGSNVGDREAMLQAALSELQAGGVRVARVSSVYATEPMERLDQRWFLNLVAEAQTDLFPMQLLARIGTIEKELGRKRIVANGPRTIDIDILFYGNSVVKTPSLTIPHPRFAQRRFVLAPMAELAPDFRDPISRRPMRELAAATLGQSVRKVAWMAQI